jgi:hypothetical protein
VRRTAVAIGLALGVAIAIAFAALGVGSGAAHAASPSTPTHADPAENRAPARLSAGSGHARLLVTAREFSFTLSRQRLKPGRAIIQLHNAGEDAHDLRLARVGATNVVGVRETAPGGVNQVKTVLHSGTWKLWCSLPGHAKAGMRATLIVRR